ncbi:hypothetical protein ACWW0F_000297 [Campylobacter coli]|nr:hypothetical protein [Campylobacter coli]EHQ0836156.1 hypothetical protein [Campylobacter coli]EID7849750.1 hypothetical protein [Campylobacter coli]EIF1390401.1 hypothetical protein [Campylobacter coli]EIJ6158991.1 hypothetical protein [Campylobacter coli]
MAFYNPQRVVFNPDTGVIQNAGKVGGVLYDIMSKSFDDKVKANEFQQEQDLRKQQMEFNQAMQNNQLLQNERNFDYQKERANIADQQWQMNYNQRARQYAMQNALRQQAINANKAYKDLNYQKGLLELQKLQNEINAKQNALRQQAINANKAYKDLNYQKGLLELQKLQNEINAKQKEQDLLNGVLSNSQGLDSQNNANLQNNTRYKADAQFLDLASNQGKTYDTTHGFWNGAIERGFGGWGSQSTDLNDASDLFLKRMQSDLLRGGKNAKWNLENIQANFPINGYTMEANNQRVAQALAGEWLAEAPNSFKIELAERLGNAKTNIEKQSAIEDYKNNMDFYNNYAPKVKAFYWDEKYSKPSKNAVIIDNSTTNQNIQNDLAKNILEVQNQNTPKLHSVSFNGINAQISEPDANGNVILVNQAGRKMQVSVEELKKQGLIQ